MKSIDYYSCLRKCLLFLSLSLFLCNAIFASISKKIIGTWKCETTLTYKVDDKFVKIEKVPVHFVINEAAIMKGQIGSAVLKDCKISERNWFEKLFKFGAPYRVNPGVIVGKTTELDPKKTQKFAFPFRFEDKKILGTIMVWDSKFSYPRPLSNRIKLEKVEAK